MPTNNEDVIEIPVGQRADGSVPTDDVTEDEDEPDTFPRKYVEKLRAESAQHRTEAKEAREALEPLQRELFAMRVEKLARLADPTDLPFDVALLADEAALNSAIDTLLAAKPHLASRKVSGSIGQGQGNSENNNAGLLAGLLRANA